MPLRFEQQWQADGSGRDSYIFRDPNRVTGTINCRVPGWAVANDSPYAAYAAILRRRAGKVQTKGTSSRLLSASGARPVAESEWRTAQNRGRFTHSAPTQLLDLNGCEDSATRAKHCKLRPREVLPAWTVPMPRPVPAVETRRPTTFGDGPQPARAAAEDRPASAEQQRWASSCRPNPALPAMPSRQRVAIEMALPAIEAIEDDSIVFKTSQPSPVGEVKHVARVVSDGEI